MSSDQESNARIVPQGFREAALEIVRKRTC